MNAVDIIVKKRDGHELSRQEIEFFIQGLTASRIPDYQVAAWAMAVYFRGMSDRETTDLTLAMAASGDQLDLHDTLPPGTIIVDKHSSGGVGDKTTLAAGPIVAACGLPVGKMSGRGLSFTGGTIDKLESIPGWSAELSEAQFRRQLAEIGLVVAAQTANLAPADKSLYALRDVTGTVPSLPLIAASIMSKKLAAGADAIVLDVKCGHGAFMETLESARTLSRIMVAIGDLAGRKATALITQMEQPLGRAVGNAMEVQEAIDTLRGEGPADFQELVETVSAEMLLIAHAAHNHAEAARRVRAAITSGAALAKFAAFVAAQGGNARVTEDRTILPSAPVHIAVTAPCSGYVHAIDARAIGLAVVALGGGRQKKGEAIDPRVGVMVQAKVGDHVAVGDALCTIHAADETSARWIVDRLLEAYTLQPEAARTLPILLDRIAAIWGAYLMQRVRAYSIEILLTAALIAAVFFFGYLGYGLLRPEVINEPFSGERALTSAGKLLDFGPRITGTGANVEAGDWLIEQLRLLGWDVVIQPFSVSEEVSGRNIVAVRSNSQPGSPVIMLATPYDSRLAADADTDPDNQQRATPGANASASGVATLLELARTLDVEQSGHTICLGFFDAEQNGGLPGWEPHLGSQVYVRSLPLSVPRCASPRYVVGVEAVGAADQRFFQTEDSDRTLENALWQTAANLDYEKWFPRASQPPVEGVQSAFTAAEMPSAAINGADYPAHNTMLDTLDKLNADTLQRVGMTLETWLEARP